MISARIANEIAHDNSIDIINTIHSEVEAAIIKSVQEGSFDCFYASLYFRDDQFKEELLFWLAYFGYYCKFIDEEYMIHICWRDVDIENDYYRLKESEDYEDDNGAEGQS